MKAWHFVGKTLRGGQTIPKDGVWLEHKGPLKMCLRGLHASKNIRDAAHFAPGLMLCRVEVEGDVEHDTYKLVARRRKIIYRINFEEALKAFSRWSAMSVAHLWAPSKFVYKFLRTGEGERAKVRTVAANAAYAAVTSSSSHAYAAANAAYAAVNDSSSRAAAHAAHAASDAAHAASYAAADAYTAARNKQEKILKEFVKEVRAGITEWEFY